MPGRRMAKEAPKHHDDENDNDNNSSNDNDSNSHNNDSNNNDDNDNVRITPHPPLVNSTGVCESYALLWIPSVWALGSRSTYLNLELSGRRWIHLDWVLCLWGRSRAAAT